MSKLIDILLAPVAVLVAAIFLIFLWSVSDD